MPAATAIRRRPDLRFLALWRVAGWGFVALVVWLSLTPDPPRPRELLDIDVGHLAAYAWLMFWFGQLDVATAARLRAAIALCVLGIGLEIAQATTGYRMFSLADMRDDAVGVALGWLAAASPLARVLPRIDAVLAHLAARS